MKVRRTNDIAPRVIYSSKGSKVHGSWFMVQAIMIMDNLTKSCLPLVLPSDNRTSPDVEVRVYRSIPNHEPCHLRSHRY